MDILKRTLLALTINLLLNSCLMSQTIDPVMKEKIDRFIMNEFLPLHHNPGLSFALTSGNGSLLYSTGYGLMDVENHLPTTNETLFFIGSISKSFFTITLVKMLHEKFPQKDDVLDTPIRKLIPEYNFTLNDRFRSEQVTFRDMLSHRVCSTSDGVAALAVPFKSTPEIAYRQRYAKEACGIRTAYVYNNAMLSLATEVLQAIAGRPYKTLLLELLNQLEMTTTTFLKAEDPDYVTGRAVPYYWKDGERHNFNPKLLKRVVLTTAAGGIVTNARDMSKYLQFHLNKGKVGDRQVVPESVMNWLYEPAIHTLVGEDTYQPGESRINFAYGQTLHLGSYNGWQLINHGGSLPPFISEISIVPALNIGIFSASNQRPLYLTLGHSQLHTRIIDILTNKPQKFQKTQQQNTLKESKDTKMPHQPKLRKVLWQEGQLQDYIGFYGSGLQGELEIKLKFRNETNSIELYMDYGEWWQAYLLQTETESKFLIYWDSDAIQDRYAFGLDALSVVGVFNENSTKFEIFDDDTSYAIFEKGVRLSLLPPVPWSPDSCGSNSN